MVEPFAITDCAIISISTGEKAHNLRELRGRLLRLDDPGIMYYHFWDVLLRPRFIDIATIDPYFNSLTELRDERVNVFAKYEKEET
jgi:hypothetical protein